MERRKYLSSHTIGFSNLKDFSSVEEFSELLDQYLLDTLTVNRLVSPIKTDKEGLRAFIGWLAFRPTTP